MIDRRDFILMGGCAAALGTAHWLRPRDKVDLVADRSIDTLLPRSFGRWRSTEGGDIVVPQSEGSLADRLYSTIVARNYTTPDSAPPVMLLVAHGGLQSDLLQLHRPEACYPAVGFAIASRQEGSLPLEGAGATIPVVNLTAKAGNVVEDIIYWTRMGEYLPRSAGEQRRDRLAAAMQGYIGDGVLVRASLRRTDDGDQHARVGNFLAELMQAVAPEGRNAFVGTALATEIART